MTVRQSLVPLVSAGHLLLPAFGLLAARLNLGANYGKVLQAQSLSKSSGQERFRLVLLPKGLGFRGQDLIRETILRL